MMIILSHFYGQLLCCELHESQTRRQLRVRIPKYPKVCCQPSPSSPTSTCFPPSRSVCESFSRVCSARNVAKYLATFWPLGCFLYKWQLIKLLAPFPRGEGGGGCSGAAFLAQNSNLVSKLSPRFNCCPRNELQLNSFSHFLLPLLSLVQLLALILMPTETLIPRGTSHVPTVSRNYVNCKLAKLC